MKRKGWILLFSGMLLIVTWGVLVFREVPVLEIVNTDRTEKFHLRVIDSSRFSLSYLHSIYLQPVTEEFEVGKKGEIILRGVKTQSQAVAAYYGFEEGRDHYPLHLKMKSLALRLGMSSAQILSYGKQEISLGELGEKGDRVEIRLVPMKWGSYLLSRVNKEKG